MNIAVFSHPKLYQNEAAWINKLFEAGLARFHLRKPGWNTSQHRDLLDSIDHKYLAKVVIHREFELCREYELEGVHLGTQFKREGLLGTMARKLVSIRFSNYLNAMTCHSISELENLPAWINLAFLSPVFTTISEKTNKSGFEDRRLRQAMKQRRNFQLYALGGVHSDTIVKAQELGFDGAAMIGAIWAEKDPLAGFLKVVHTLEGSSPILAETGS